MGCHYIPFVLTERGTDVAWVLLETDFKARKLSKEDFRKRVEEKLKEMLPEQYMHNSYALDFRFGDYGSDLLGACKSYCSTMGTDILDSMELTRNMLR